MEDKPLVNRVAASGLITLNLEEFYPAEPILPLDIKDYLFHGLILKEQDFREAMKAYDWSQSQGAHLAVFCSTDAIIPVWAWQLVAIHAQPFAASITFGDTTRFLELHYWRVLNALDLEPYRDKRIVVKGCSQKPVPPAAYLEIARLLRPLAKSIMYGEPCSTVPLYKKGG